MHVLAADYLTGLRVQVYGTDASGRVSVYFRAPTAFLAWPAGQAGGAVVWDRATAARLAPHGVVSSVVLAALGPLEAGEVVMPPVKREQRNTEAEIADEGE